MDKTIKLACLLAMVIFSSCASRKDFVYLQDMDELQEYPMVQKYEAIIHRDDRLSIIVNSKNPELSLPFNMSGSRSYSVEADGTISNNEVGALSDEKEKRERINELFSYFLELDEKDCYVEFPIDAFKSEDFDFQLKGTCVTVLKAFNLENKAKFPNFEAIKEFLDVRFNMSTDRNDSGNPLAVIISS